MTDLFHDKADFDGRSENTYMENFKKFLYKALKTNSEAQKKLITVTFSCLRARSMWELDSIINEI